MPSVTVKITVDEKDATKALALAQVVTSPSFFALFLRTRAADYFRKRAESRFTQEGDNASGAWVPLQESTINIRDSQGFPPSPINVREGDLKRAVTGARGISYPIPGGAELMWPAPSDLVGFQVPQKYEVAQFGSPPQGGMGPTPKRPVVAANEEDLAAIVDLLALELKMSLERGMSITINAVET